MFTLLSQKCIRSILDFASWPTKPKIFTLTQSMITLTLYRKNLLLLALGQFFSNSGDHRITWRVGEIGCWTPAPEILIQWVRIGAKVF